ncbi:hypothetical protein XELAEV_18026048mg [Xenopus laevis]|uniref:Uncharacterized protein n=1 Tax=Xenopus laevis TaxID=8355 RepID=A0A974CT76_XENLA|nr:hypothetical protein XELAEV_18026048mg [Xenopus laevis]
MEFVVFLPAFVFCFQGKSFKKHKLSPIKEKQEKQEVEIWNNMTVADLARAMNKDTGGSCDFRATERGSFLFMMIRVQIWVFSLGPFSIWLYPDILHSLPP